MLEMSIVTNKFFGKYRAKVSDNKDPLRLGRVRLQIPEIFGEDQLTDFAYPVNNTIFGMVFIPKIGDRVWAEFEAGDVNRPIYSMSWYAIPGGTSELPELAREIRDRTTESPVGTDTAVNGSGDSLDEPQPPYAATYPFNRVLETLGVTIEIDDTSGEERLKFFHKSGAYLEVRKDGSIVQKAQGKNHRISIGDDVVHVNGKRNKIVEGDDEETIKGQKRIFVSGGWEEITEGKTNKTFKEDVTEKVRGTKTVTVDGIAKENYLASQTVSVGGSKSESIGNQKTTTVIETISELIGNSGGAAVAKLIHILSGNNRTLLVLGDDDTKIEAGNHVVEITVGDKKITLDSGNYLLEVTAGEARIGSASATESAVLGDLFKTFLDAFITLFNAHTHSGVFPGGSSTAPPSAVQTLMPSSNLSSKVKIAL